MVYVSFIFKKNIIECYIEIDKIETPTYVFLLCYNEQILIQEK